MSYIVFFLPPVVAVIVLLVAIKNGFNKQAFMVSAGITMVINMFAMHKLTWYGLLCTLTVPLAAAYEGYTYEEILKEYEKKYWTAQRGKSQPKPAFLENAKHIIGHIVDTFGPDNGKTTSAE